MLMPMIDNLDAFFSTNDYDTLGSLKIGANKENTKSFIYPNVGTLYNAVPDIPYETRVWIEKDGTLVTHGKIWFDGSFPDSSRAVTMLPYKFMGHQLYKMCCSIDDLQHANYADLFGNDKIVIYDIKGSAVKDGKVGLMSDVVYFNTDMAGNVANFGTVTGTSAPMGVTTTYCEIQFWYNN